MSRFPSSFADATNKHREKVDGLIDRVVAVLEASEKGGTPVEEASAD